MPSDVSSRNPDYHRRDPYEAIENGELPEYELFVQMIEDEDEHKFDFDILDATKHWPEEPVPPKEEVSIVPGNEIPEGEMPMIEAPSDEAPLPNDKPSAPV